MRVSQSRSLFLAWTVFSVSVLQENPAQTSETPPVASTAVFAIAADSSTPAGPAFSIDPIVIIDQGRFVKPPERVDQNQAGKFRDTPASARFAAKCYRTEHQDAGNSSNDIAKQPEDGNDESEPSQDDYDAKLKAFIVALQKAVAADNRRKVASMIRYPIIIQAGGRNVLFRGPSSLVASYDLVFTPRRKKGIAEARAEDLFGNWQGAMIDRGDIWINRGDSGALKIITINDEMGARPPKPLAPELKVHPKVFSLIDYPTVKEVNLDDNQFKEEVRQQDGWTKCDHEDGRGFLRYRVVEAVGNRYTVEYQDNGGGTYTESAIIEFVVETRQVRTDGKLKSTRVLRVLAYTAT